MDKNLRAQVFKTYNRYANAFNEADMETINDCIAYSLPCSNAVASNIMRDYAKYCFNIKARIFPYRNCFHFRFLIYST
jgi:hypothetical protein